MQFNREPKLSDFWQPSDEMKQYQLIYIAVFGLTSGYLIHKLV